jgi:hypothetical protein
MAGRGPQSFKKRQKEQQRKEKQQEKIASGWSADFKRKRQLIPKCGSRMRARLTTL